MGRRNFNQNKSTSPLTTAKVLVDRSFDAVDETACVDWAISMLEQGHDGEYLVRLAGLMPPLNPFEVADCLAHALQELGFAHLTDSQALAMYVTESLLPAIENHQDLTPGLRKLKDICVFLDYSDDDFYDFYRLYYAYRDLKESDTQYYWEGATKDNIVSIIHQYAKEYIQLHMESLFSQRFKDVKCGEKIV